MLYNMEMTVDYLVLFVITVFWNGFGAIVTANLGVRKNVLVDAITTENEKEGLTDVERSIL